MRIISSDVHARHFSNTPRDRTDLSQLVQSNFQKIKDGQATPTDLLNFVLTISEGESELMTQSMGMNWMHQNPARLQALVGDVDAFLEEVLSIFVQAEACGEPTDVLKLGRWFFPIFLSSRPLMGLLSPAWRERCVREIYPHFGAPNSDWMRTAVLSGVPRASIARAILDRLERASKNEHLFPVVNEFLRKAQGHRTSCQIHSALKSLGTSWQKVDALHPGIQHDPSSGFEEIEMCIQQGIVPSEGTFPTLSAAYLISNHEFEEAIGLCAHANPALTMVTLRDHDVKARLTHKTISKIINTIAEHEVDGASTYIETIPNLGT